MASGISAGVKIADPTISSDNADALGQAMSLFAPDGNKLPDANGVKLGKIEKIPTPTMHPMAKVEKVNDRMPRNCNFACQKFYEHLPDELKLKYPDGVQFTDDGFPDFSNYAIHRVEIEFSGKHDIDFSRADKKLLLKDAHYVRSKDYTWHHHQDGKTMELVPKDLHKSVEHTGGMAINKHRKRGVK